MFAEKKCAAFRARTLAVFDARPNNIAIVPFVGTSSANHNYQSNIRIHKMKSSAIEFILSILNEAIKLNHETFIRS